MSDEPVEASVLGGLGRWLDDFPTDHYCGCVVIQLDTLRALYEHGYRLSVFCRPCGRHVCLDIPTLLAAGHGDAGGGGATRTVPPLRASRRAVDLVGPTAWGPAASQ